MGWDSGSIPWKQSCLRRCSRRISSRILAAISSEVNFGGTSPNGEGLIWCALVGGAGGETDRGMHLRLFGDLPFGLCRGSQSCVRFNVAQAIPQ